MKKAMLWIVLIPGLVPVAWGDVTQCDRQASHPDDPDRNAPGLETAEMDLKSAEAACRAAVLEHPTSPRAHYHLSRVLFYQGRVAESLPPLQHAADAGYRQAMFVLGFLYSDALPEKDYCRASGLWKRAAALEHPWSAYHLVEKTMAGRLHGCDPQPGRGDLERLMRLAEDSITIAASAGRVERLRMQLDAYDSAAKSGGKR